MGKGGPSSPHRVRPFLGEGVYPFVGEVVLFGCIPVRSASAIFRKGRP